MRPLARLAAGAAAALAGLSALVLVAPATSAEYAVVEGAVQWVWAAAAEPGRIQVTDIAVRDDGWMIVATATFADGHLHLVPPWGARLDASTRLGGPAYGFRQIELRRGRLFGLRQEHQRRGDETHNPGELIEVDAGTGELVHHHGSWWFQDLTVDPISEDLVLQTSGQGREPYAHDLVRFNPERGTQTVLVPDQEPRSDRPLEVAFSPDGELLFTANVAELPPTIDVRRRSGAVLHTLQSGQVDALVTGRPGTCFDGLLVLTRSDGSVFTIASASGSAPVPVAAGGRPTVVSYAALDRDGHVATARFADVTLVACPGFVPPRAPGAVPSPPPTPVAEVAAAPPSAPATIPAPSSAPPPAPPSAPPGPAPAPPPPAPATPPAPVAPPGALGTAMQAASAPSVGAADAPEEEHITSVAASARPGLVISLGAVVAMALLAYAVAVPSPTVVLHRVKGNR
jgi:hypothetical protein